MWLHLVVLSGHALPPGIGPGNAQMGQLVAGTAAAGGWQIADGRRRGARGQVVAGRVGQDTDPDPHQAKSRYVIE